MKKQQEKPQEKPQEFPDVLYVWPELVGYTYTRKEFVGHKSADDLSNGCMGVYKLVHTQSVRQVRVVESGCPQTPAKGETK